MLKQLFLSGVIAVAVLVGLSACNTTTNKPDTPKDPHAIGMANPAAKHCIAKGGKYRLVTNSDGSMTGLCTLANGVGCDAAAFIRGDCPKACPHPVNPNACPRYAPPHPNYCKGGQRYTTKNSCGCYSPVRCDMTPQ